MRCVILGGEREGWVDGGREGERMYGWMDVVGRKASRKEYVQNIGIRRIRFYVHICKNPKVFKSTSIISIMEVILGLLGSFR